jgi:SAM-dependent methyltransferase
MRSPKRGVVLALMLCAAAGALRAPAQNDAADVERLVTLLDLHEGSVVADIGAGSGALSVQIAAHVGQSGRVYSTDIDTKRLGDIRRAVARAELSTVTVVEGRAADTNLPEQSCDAIFMRDVYHHFADPAAMNASLLRTLKLGGRLAIIDFAPRSGRRQPPGKRAEGRDHGVQLTDVVEELTAAGFADVRQADWSSSGNFAVIGMRPR